MRPPGSVCTWFCVLILLGMFAPTAYGAPQGTLAVRAARVDVTPPADAALPMSGYSSRKKGFENIHEQVSCEITATHLKPGCAEDGIVNGPADMMNGH